jgi:Mor family transcriptional regulator
MAEKDKYTLKITYLPNGNVQSITIRKHEMSSEELGSLVSELDQEYKPLKMIVMDV